MWRGDFSASRLASADLLQLGVTLGREALALAPELAADLFELYRVGGEVGVHRRLFATRESLAKAMEMEDRLSSDEILTFDPRFAALRRTILHVRDQRLIEKLGEELDRTAGRPSKIAIIYGAAHMRAVLAELSRRNFRTAGASWQMVMRF